ncbi:MAG: hypothetical protein HYW07_00875 [Candidatus Latescibacteria bacterium]|nr:hypothetical protein [Candidatus Latescibacterota bacterium]
MTPLARLSFWVPVERLGDFEAEYRKKLLPLLEKHGLEESAERSWPTVEGVFSRLFAVEGPAQIALKREALRRDPAWQQALSKAAAFLGTTSLDLPLQYRFGPYRFPSGPGRTAEVGPGLRQGLWSWTSTAGTRCG